MPSEKKRRSPLAGAKIVDLAARVEMKKAVEEFARGLPVALISTARLMRVLRERAMPRAWFEEAGWLDSFFLERDLPPEVWQFQERLGLHLEEQEPKAAAIAQSFDDLLPEPPEAEPPAEELAAMSEATTQALEHAATTLFCFADSSAVMAAKGSALAGLTLDESMDPYGARSMEKLKRHFGAEGASAVADTLCFAVTLKKERSRSNRRN